MKDESSTIERTGKPDAMEGEENELPASMRLMNDPRVTAFLRFLVTLLGALTLATVLGLAHTATSWNTTMQRLTYIVEDLSKRTDANEKDLEALEKILRDLQVKSEVSQNQQRTMVWQINNLMRKVGQQ